MNREIKFRAWDTHTKKMIATGFDVLGETTCFNLIEQWLHEHPKDNTHSLIRMNDVALMQFTGIKDNNGTDIYEGDIVRQLVLDDWDKINDKPILAPTDKISSIEYSHRSFWVKGESFGWEGEEMWDWDKLEVLGNIYANPELIPPKTP